MKGITIGLGEYEQYANAAAKLAIKNLKLDDVYVIRDPDVECIPNLMKINRLDYRSYITKFYLFEISGFDNFIYFDADVAFVSTPPAHVLKIINNNKNFLAVRDRPYNEGLIEVEDDVGIPRNTYINAGLFVANKHHHDLFKLLQHESDLMHEYLEQIKYQDQYLLNAALYRFAKKFPTVWLHRYWNAQDWNPGWRILPYAIHSSWNYGHYRGDFSVPEYEQGSLLVPPANNREAFTIDGFVFNKDIGRIDFMYRTDRHKTVIKHK